MLSTGRRCDGRGAFDYFRARACAGDREEGIAGACLRLGFAGGDIRSGQRLGHGAARDRVFPRAALYQRRAGGAFEPDSGARAESLSDLLVACRCFPTIWTRRRRIFWRCRRRQSTTRRKKPARTSAGQDLDRKSGKLHARKTVFRAFSRFYMLFRMDRVRKMAYNTRA